MFCRLWKFILGENGVIEKKQLSTLHIIIYLIIFFAVWSVRELVIQPVFLSPLSNITSEIIGEAIKLLVWTLPAILLIRHYKNDMSIGLMEMFTTKPKWFKDAPILLLVFIPILQALVTHGTIAIDPNFNPTRLIGAVIFVGITEELVFRGFLLNAFLKRLEMKRAIALNEVLFVLIHYPIWIYQGLELSVFPISSLSVFIFGVLFSYSFIKTRNIFVPITLHMITNLLTMLLHHT